jgi:hypothetical protein
VSGVNSLARFGEQHGGNTGYAVRPCADSTHLCSTSCEGSTYIGETTSVERVLATPLHLVTIHIRRALELLSDNKTPDYRNSINESISAVESSCQCIVEDQKAASELALKKIDEGQ